MWGELASHKTHSPIVLKAGHPVSCSRVISCVFVYVFCMDILGFVDICWWWFLLYNYLSIIIILYTYGWYSMNYNFMHPFAG